MVQKQSGWKRLKKTPRSSGLRRVPRVQSLSSMQSLGDATSTHQSRFSSMRSKMSCLRTGMTTPLSVSLSGGATQKEKDQCPKSTSSVSPQTQRLEKPHNSPVRPSKDTTYGDTQASLIEELTAKLKAVRMERDDMVMRVMDRIIRYRKASKRSKEMEYQKEDWYKDYSNHMSSYSSTIISLVNRLISLRR